VRQDRLPGRSFADTFAWAQADMLVGGRGSLYRGIADQSNGTGVVGDPTTASADKGARITSAVVDVAERIIRSLHG
jgi:creatinine amidohydrolase